MKKLILTLLVIALIVPCSASARKRGKRYEVIEVTNGGSIVGTVKASEKIADPVAPIVTKKADEVEFCGKDFKMGKFIISDDLGVKNVVVAVTNAKKGKAMPTENLELDNVKCQFTPLVGIAYKKAKFIIKNSDPIFHNTSMGLMMKGKRSTVYNLALPNQNQVIEKPVKRTGMLDVKCDSHPWMRSYIYAAKNPYVALTGDGGSFEIKDLPPGSYKVMVWHEGLGQETIDVEVKAGEATTLDHTFAKK
ncbi:MAG: carboxypeptidase regulatory-like domain-containing protein [Thermodesulfobacteriota bacterium]